MPILVETVLILIALWLAVLGPRWLRRLSRRQSDHKYSSVSPLLSGISRDNNVVPLRDAASLQSPPRLALVLPGMGVDQEGFARRRRERARLRRRNIVIVLSALAAITLVVAVAVGGFMIGVHLAVDVLLAGYIGALTQRRRRVLERHARVTDVAPAPMAADSLRRRPESAPAEAALGYISSGRG